MSPTPLHSSLRRFAASVAACACLGLGTPAALAQTNAPDATAGIRSILVVPSVNKSLDVDAPLYVLSALTLVSQTAQAAMPWLYESVVYAP